MQCLFSVGRGTCLEATIMGLALLFVTLTAHAQEMGNTLARDFMNMVDDGLWIAVLLSVFGGVVGLLGRLRDTEWMAKAKQSGIALSILGELTFSVFTGVIILFYGKNAEYSNLAILTGILAGSWLGTKAGRLAMSYLKENREKVANLIAGGAKNGTDV